MKNKERIAKLALLGVAMIWGTSFVVLKNTLDSVTAFWVLSIRFTVSALIFLLLAGKKLFSASRRCITGGVLLGVMLAVAYAFQTYGLVFTTPGKNAFLTATYCVLTPFLAWLLFRRNPGVSSFTAAVVCIIGIGFVSLNEGFHDINVGDMLTLVCGIFYAMQIVIMEQYRDSGDVTVLKAVEFATAAVLLTVAALIFEPLPKAVPKEAWLSIAYLAVMCTAVGFFLQAWAIQYTSSATAAMLMTLESVFGALISVLFYGEQVTGKLFIGFVLIFSAVLVSELKPLDTLRKN